MVGYILGMTFGGILMVLFLSHYFYKLIIKFRKRSLIKDIGRTAEEKINADISIWTKHSKSFFIPSTIFAYGKNKVFEVDSVLITDKAIIVVEIKSIKGSISGDAKLDYLIKTTSSNNYKIRNPIIQNDKHIRHVINMTNAKMPIISLIVFSNKAQEINIEKIPQHVVITKHIELYKVLDEISLALPVRMTGVEVKKYYKLLTSFKANSKQIASHKRIVGDK